MDPTPSTINSGVVVSGTFHSFREYCGNGGITGWSNVVGLPLIEAQLVSLPGRRSLEWVPHTPRTRSVTIAMILSWPTEAECLANLLSIGSLIDDETAPITLRRNLPHSGSDVAADISAIYVSGFDPDRVVGRIHRLALVFQTLTPYWLVSSTEQAG